MAILLTLRPPGDTAPRELTFDQSRVRIGRGAMCDIRLPHRTVSSVHAMILLERDRFFLVDPGSTNGTIVGDEVLVVERRKLLRSGDLIRIGGFELEFRSGVAMVSYHNQERTASVARQLARQVMVDDGFELRDPALVVLEGPQTGERFELPLGGGSITIGRSEESDVILDDREASRHHAILDMDVESVVLRDAGGKNPLLVNDRVVSRHRLRDGDELLIGATRLVFDEPVEAYLRELARWPDAQMPKETQLSRESWSSRGSGEQVPTHLEVIAPDAESLSSVKESPGVVDNALEAPLVTAPERLLEGKRDRPSHREPTSQETLFTGSRHWLRINSTGAEIAILLVGAIALASCVAALVWIFR